MSNGPLFIGGAERSGKTYLRFMLISHPAFAISRRTNLWTRYYRRFGNLHRSDNRARCLQAILQHKHVHALHIDEARLRQQFQAGPHTYARLFALIHEQYAAREGKPRWGDQTQLVERPAIHILSAYPDAKLIQLIRDPRDRYEALCARDKQRPHIGAATAKWLHSAAMAERNRRAFPGRTRLLRYEAMVTDPAATMRDVCAFLNIDYRPEMLHMTGAARFQQPDVSPDGPLTTAYIGRYRQRLSAHEITFIQEHAGQQMQALGYALDPIHLSARDKLRFYLGTWGPHTAGLLGWRALIAARTR